MGDDRSRLAFALVPPPTFVGLDSRLHGFLRFIGDRAGRMIVRRHVDSYAELVTFLRAGAIDIAWLPPIPFARLEAEGKVRALVCAERGGQDSFVAILITQATSRIASVEDMRRRPVHVGWVDPLSTTGYVVPRMRLATRFPDETLFAKESFFGSHASVVRAVLDGTVDVGATYGGFETDGTLVRGAFQDVGARLTDVQVIEAFGSIPPDVVAVSADLDEKLESDLAGAFEATSRDPAMLDVIRTVFGAMFFARKPLVGYDLLRTEIEHGVDSGVIPAAAAFLSTRPPPAED